MKIIRNKKELIDQGGLDKQYPARRKPWKLMIVDDEPDVHRLTHLNLKGFSFSGRSLELISAHSFIEAKQLLHEHEDIAVALIDVVMETNDAGLKLVEYIRQELNNEMVRLMIRTGQPGAAPERYVIDNYDIDGYHDKTDLTAQRLYTSVRSAIKSYRDLRTIELNRIGLSHVLHATRDLYHFRSSTIGTFFEGILTQIVGLFNLGGDSLMSTIDGMIFSVDGEEVNVRAGTGAFTLGQSVDPRMDEIAKICANAILTNIPIEGLRSESMVLPLLIEDQPVGFVYLEHTDELTNDDRDLIQVMTNQCAGALENLRLNMEVTESYEHVIDMLALAAEYRDSTTGEHINRLAALTEMLALEVGVPAKEAKEMGKASRLHDVGKVGIPDVILQKPGKLDPDEFEMVKAHATIGANILGRDKKLSLARTIALSHHEQWSGQGYPNGLAGEEIPLSARIVSIVDVYDALTHERPYKGAWSKESAIEFIQQEKNSRFDPDLVDALIRVVESDRYKPMQPA